MSVALNHASSEGKVAICCKQQTTDKSLPIDILQYEYPESIKVESKQKQIK